MKDPWHYRRKGLAGSYLDVLDSGVSNRITLFAPRRKGKTEFLIYDLGPEAERRKYRVVYVSCWENLDAPQVAIIEALQNAADTIKRRRSITRSLLAAEIKKVKINSLFNILGAELEFASAPETSTAAQQQQITRLVAGLAKGRRTKLLLMIDEVQHLTTRSAFDGLTHTLRSVLDKHRHIRVVFTGSSRRGIRAMFDDDSAPFFDSSDLIQFPDLGRDFVAHQTEVFKSVTKRAISELAVWKAFVKFDHNPFYLRNLLKAMILDPTLKINDAYQYVLESIAAKRDYRAIWSKLRPLEKVVLLAVLEGNAVYSAEMQDQFAVALREQSISRSQVQYALRRLVQMQLVTPMGRGRFETEIPGFEAWIKQRSR